MSTQEFSASLEAQHERLDPDDHGAIYVVGDVHGCRATTQALLDRIDPSPDDLVLFVGDLVRRGPDSSGVVDLVRSHPNCRSIRGNNEEKIISGRRAPDGLSPADIRWLRSLPAVFSWDRQLVVHGGLYPDRPRSDHTPADVQNAESVATDGDGPPFWWERFTGPERVFFGHKVLACPYVGDHAIGLDTGCVYGGPLTAYDCDRERTIAVESEGAYRERPSRKFLDPYDPAA